MQLATPLFRLPCACRLSHAARLGRAVKFDTFQTCLSAQLLGGWHVLFSKIAKNSQKRDKSCFLRVVKVDYSLRSFGLQTCGEITMKKLFALLIVAILCVAAFAPTTASATTPAYYEEGSAAMGAIPLNQTDVTISSLHLNFDVEDFPLVDADFDFAQYRSKMEATYTLQNPTNSATDVTLCVPTFPLPYYNYERNFDDDDKYLVEVNEVATPAQRRITFNNFNSRYSEDFVAQLQQFADAKAEDERYSESMVVRKRTYSASCSNATEDNFSLSFDVGSENTPVVLFRNNYFCDVRPQSEFNVKNNSELTFYFFGDETEINNVRFFETYYEKGEFTERNLQGELTFLQEETTTFGEVLYAFCNENFNRTDWHNAVLTALKADDYPRLSFLLSGEIRMCLTRWLVFNVHVEANSVATVKMTTPLYPGIEGGYSPYVYNYRFNRFSDVWQCENCTYTINNHDFFVISDDGFSNSGELSFRLCSEENPKSNNGAAVVLLLLLLFLPVAIVVYGIHGLAILCAVMSCFLFVVKIVCAIVLGIRHERKRRQRIAEKQSTAALSEELPL